MVGASCRDAFTESLETPHLRLDPALDVVSRPVLPDRPAIVPGKRKDMHNPTGTYVILNDRVRRLRSRALSCQTFGSGFSVCPSMTTT